MRYLSPEGAMESHDNSGVEFPAPQLGLIRWYSITVVHTTG